ncbi:hypothetical protein BDU57DRAFT_532058 [Ampelomyces quisqualis]|uniref:Uncharacterized protein n=1 Tax=Ampelomyces quisqualis TaxID=50730 RepID=A0A6A5QC41_AMPQU|nr:hypothetical protein BDU57DRAFT_532058 [Ampelomyces quisqualis]
MNLYQPRPYKKERQDEKNSRSTHQKRITVSYTTRTAEPQYANELRRPLEKARRLLDRVGHVNKSSLQQTSGPATRITTPMLHDSDPHSTSHISQEAHTMDSWLGEWETASSDPLPSDIRSLWLLLSPTSLNLKKHARSAQDAELIHYCPDMAPKGRAEQELRLGEEQDERLRFRLEQGEEELARNIERHKERNAVLKQSRRVKVIDLTEDPTIDGNALRSIRSNLPTRHPIAPAHDSQQPSYHGLHWISDSPLEFAWGNTAQDAHQHLGMQTTKWAHNDQGPYMPSGLHSEIFSQPSYSYESVHTGSWSSRGMGSRDAGHVSWEDVDAP